MVTDLVPELLTSHQRAQLVLGLRARVRKCRSDYEQLALLDVFCFHNVFFKSVITAAISVCYTALVLSFFTVSI